MKIDGRNNAGNPATLLDNMERYIGYLNHENFRPKHKNGRHVSKKGIEKIREERKRALGERFVSEYCSALGLMGHS